MSNRHTLAPPAGLASWRLNSQTTSFVTGSRFLFCNEGETVDLSDLRYVYWLQSYSSNSKALLYLILACKCYTWNLHFKNIYRRHLVIIFLLLVLLFVIVQLPGSASPQPPLGEHDEQRQQDNGHDCHQIDWQELQSYVIIPSPTDTQTHWVVHPMSLHVSTDIRPAENSFRNSFDISLSLDLGDNLQG